MKKTELIEALRLLARGHMSAAELVADLLMPEPVTFEVPLPADDAVAEVYHDHADAIVSARRAKKAR